MHPPMSNRVKEKKSIKSDKEKLLSYKGSVFLLVKFGDHIHSL